MNFKLTALLILTALSTSCNTNPTGLQALERSMAYHDPNNQWAGFKGMLTISMSSPEQSERISEVSLDLPGNTFRLKATKDSITTYRTWEEGICTFSLNGDANPDPEQIEIHRGSCERTTMMKNYYTYLYGLPMKLKDPGSRIAEKAELREFMGKEYRVVKVEYDPEVGTDTWYFYLDPETYAMEAYQFFKDEKTGTGEYILLEDIMQVQGMRIPKNRAWYTNDGKYLGTDRLIAAE